MTAKNAGSGQECGKYIPKLWSLKRRLDLDPQMAKERVGRGWTWMGVGWLGRGWDGVVGAGWTIFS